MERKIFKDIWNFVLYLCLVSFFSILFLSNSDTEIHAITARQNYYAESTAVSSWATDTNYQDKTTLTFTPDDDGTYLIMASWLMQESSASYQYKAKLTRTTGTPTDFNGFLYQPKDATDYLAGGVVAYETFGTSPGSQTYKIQYGTSSTSGTARIKEAKIIAIKLNADDKYAESAARSTQTATSYGDKTTLTFTPGSTGDYIILASATIDGSSASYDTRAQLTVDGTAYSNANIEPAYVNNRYPWAMVKRVNLSSASHTLKIQFSSENTAATAGIAHARIVALRADGFANNYFAEEEARTTTASTLYQTKTTLTATPTAQDHILIGSAGIDGSSASYEAYANLLRGGTAFGEMLVETKDASNRGYGFFNIKKETLSVASTSWYLIFKSENASGTAGIKDAGISLIELNEPYVTVSSTGTQTADVYPSDNNMYMGGAFTFVRNAGNTSVTSITINNTGTISSANISDLVLFYKEETSCSSSIPGDATQFNSTPGTFSSGSSTVTGTMGVGTSQVCVYVRLDIGASASNDDTIEIQISNPSTGVLVSVGDVSPASAVAISGTTTVITDVLAVDIVDASNVPVSSPSFGFSAGTLTFVYQTTTGTLGSSSQKIYVTSGSTANWQLTMAATSGATSLWSNTGATKMYDFNDGSANAVDGGDTDSYGGQLTLNVSTGTLSPGSGCSNTGLSLGSNSSFVETTNNSITLISASSGATSCNWSLTGIGLSQSIPKEQGVDSYSINLTLTITAT